MKDVMGATCKITIFHDNRYMAENAEIMERIAYENRLKDTVKDALIGTGIMPTEIYVLYSGK